MDGRIWEIKNNYIIKNELSYRKQLFQGVGKWMGIERWHVSYRTTRVKGSLFSSPLFFWNGKMNIFVDRSKGAFGEGGREGRGLITDWQILEESGKKEIKCMGWDIDIGKEYLAIRGEKGQKMGECTGELPCREDRCYGRIYHMTSDILFKKVRKDIF